MKDDRKKNLTETLKTLAWAAICTGFVLSMNNKCAGNTQSAREHEQKSTVASNHNTVTQRDGTVLYILPDSLHHR